MEIRIADIADKPDIIALYERSQLSSGLPDPTVIPPAELGEKLYERHAIKRFVAIEAGRIVGHAIIEEPNHEHVAAWRNALENTNRPLIEMGAAFVEPVLSGRGIWTNLLTYRLSVIRNTGSHPVTATWSSNQHVKRTLEANGGIHAGHQSTHNGNVDLFAFELS